MEPVQKPSAEGWKATLYQLIDGQYSEIAEQQTVLLNDIPNNTSLLQFRELGLEWQVKRVEVAKINTPIYYSNGTESYMVLLHSRIPTDCRSQKQQSPKMASNGQHHEGEFDSLELALNQLTINKQLYEEKVRMLKPVEVESAIFSVVSTENGYYIQVGKHLTRIDQSLDFDLNKFTNRFEWYGGETWRAVFHDLESLLKLQTVLLEILSKAIHHPTDLQSKYGSQPDSEQIYQQLFFDTPQFSSHIVETYKDKMEIETISVGKVVSVMPTAYEKSVKVEFGELALSQQYRYFLVTKEHRLCLFTIPSTTSIDMHNALFTISNSKGDILSPRSLHFTEDQRSILFLSSQQQSTASTVYLYNIESSTMLEEYVQSRIRQVVMIGNTQQQLLQLHTHNNRSFYCISQSSLVELQVAGGKLKTVRSHAFPRRRLRSIFCAAEDLLLVGDDNGVVRVYNSFESKRSLNNLVSPPTNVLGICVSTNRSIVVVCTAERIFFFATSNYPSHTEPNIIKRLKKEDKTARALNLSLEDRQRYRIDNYHYTTVKLVLQEAYLVTFTRDLLVVWELKKVVANGEGCYKIVQLPERILGFQEVEQERRLLLNLQHSVAVVIIG